MSATSAATANRMARNNVSSASVTASTSTQQVEDAQRQLVAMHHRLAATKRSLSEVSCGAALSVRCTNTAPPRCRHGLTADTRHHSQVVDEYRFVEEQVILLLPHCKSAMLCEAPTSANVFVLGCLQLRQLDQARKRVRFLCDLYAEANSVHFRTIKQFRAYNLELEQCVRRLGAREALQVCVRVMCAGGRSTSNS